MQSHQSIMSYGLALCEICRNDTTRRELQWLRAKSFDDVATLELLVGADPGLPERLKGYEHEIRMRGFDLDDAQGRKDGWSWAFNVHFEQLVRPDAIKKKN